MKLPRDSTIAAEKLTQYLLVLQEKSDKSAFLERGGYTAENCETLLNDLRTQILPLEARLTKRKDYGQVYEIVETLRGPHGVELDVRTIWITEHLTGKTNFVALIPRKVRKPWQ